MQGTQLRTNRAASRAASPGAARAAAILALAALAGLGGCAATHLRGGDADQAAVQEAAKTAGEQGSWTSLQGLAAAPETLPDPIRVPAGASWPIGSPSQVAEAQQDAGRAMASQDAGWQEKVARIIAPLPSDLQFLPTAQAAARCKGGAEESPAAIIKMWTLRRGQSQAHSAAWRLGCAGDNPPPGVVADTHGKPLWLGAARRSREDGSASQKARQAALAQREKGKKGARAPAEAPAEDSGGQGVEIVQTASVGATGPGWMWAKWRTKSLSGAEGEWQSGWFWFTPKSASLSSMGRAGRGALAQWKPEAKEAAATAP